MLRGMVVVVAALALAGAARADEYPVRAIDRPLALPVGQVEAAVSIGASNAEDRDGEPATFGTWLGLRARAAVGLGSGLQLGAETLVALVRPYESELAGSFEGPYEQPLHQLGGFLVELRYAWSPGAAFSAQLGPAWPGAFGRGPLHEPRYPRLGDEQSSTGMTAAGSLGFLF